MVDLSATSATNKQILPWLVAIAFFMELLDTTILNTAVPMIADALKVSPLSMKSVLSSYTLSLAIFIPISSWVADRFGTRKVFASAIAIFTLGSLLCGLSNNIHLLVMCRILQGCGGAMMVPVGRLTLVRSFAKWELVRAMSFVSIPSLIGPMLGPLAGGLIVGYLNWRMIFFVNVPIGLLGLYFVYRYLPDFRTSRPGKLDLVGLILFGSGVALFSFVLEIFGETRLSAGEVIGLLVISLLLLAGYAIHAKSKASPLLRFGLLRIRTLQLGILGSFITRLGVGGLPFLLPLLFQIGLGYTPIQSGLLIMPQSLAALTLKLAVPSILTQFGFRRVLLWNTLIIGLCTLSFSLVQPNTPTWLIVLQSGMFGFFSSLQFTSMNTLVYADTAEEDTSQASTIVSTIQQMAMSFAVAVASLSASMFLPHGIQSGHIQVDSNVLLRGIHQAFLLLGGLTLLSLFVFWRLKEYDGANISQHKISNLPPPVLD